MRRKIIYLISIVFLFSCNSDDSISRELEVIEEIILPNLQTNEVTNITLYSVKTGGKLIDSGSSDIIEVGIVVGLSTLPTTESNIKKFILTPDQSGDFNLKITDIPPNKKYYIRAYGVNSDGSSYGNEVQFTSLEENVYNGDITLSNQQEVIDFGINKYNTINGSLNITGTVTDLSPLESIVIINNAFKVQNTQNLKNLVGLNNLKITGNIFPNGFHIKNNPGLESLSGLNNLEITRGSSYIINNDNLVNMQGLNSYYAASSGEFRIQDCDSLLDLSGLENLQFIGDTLFLMDNLLLNDISSLSNLNYVDRRIYIHNNSSLQNINGLEFITSLEGLSIINNDNLSNLDGLINATIISEIITISHNDNLNDLSVFRNLSTVEYLNIESNNSLTNLKGFDNLTLIKHRLKISNNSNLTSLKGIENLSSLKRLHINSNPLLINLEGLSGLTSIIGSSYPITITDNINLNSLEGLEKLTQVEGYIQINVNPNLNDFCALKNLFTNGNHTGNITFSGNLTNPTINEIITTCN